MKQQNTPPFFERFSASITKMTGKPVVFILAIFIILGWLMSGPLFYYSDTWQLVINTSTSIITFLMVFVIQQSQNKDTTAIQLKLNELIAASSKASNRLIDIEDLSEAELETIKKFYTALARVSKEEKNIHQTHSIDSAITLQKQKLK